MTAGKKTTLMNSQSIDLHMMTAFQLCFRLNKYPQKINIKYRTRHAEEHNRTCGTRIHILPMKRIGLLPRWVDCRSAKCCFPSVACVWVCMCFFAQMSAFPTYFHRILSPARLRVNIKIPCFYFAYSFTLFLYISKARTCDLCSTVEKKSGKIER